MTANGDGLLGVDPKAGSSAMSVRRTLGLTERAHGATPKRGAWARWAGAGALSAGLLAGGWLLMFNTLLPFGDGAGPSRTAPFTVVDAVPTGSAEPSPIPTQTPTTARRTATLAPSPQMPVNSPEDTPAVVADDSSDGSSDDTSAGEDDSSGQDSSGHGSGHGSPGGDDSSGHGSGHD